MDDQDPDGGTLDIHIPFWVLAESAEDDSLVAFVLWPDSESTSVLLFTERLFAERFLAARAESSAEPFEVRSSSWFGDRLTELLNRGVRDVAVDPPFQPGQRWWKIPIPEFIDAMPPDPH